jgi:hypothetical protein
MATVAVASFTWISSVVAPAAATDSPVASPSSSDQNQLQSIMSWAQQEEEPPIEQVGEDTDQDVETLDEAATNEDAESLDEAAINEDVESLDEAAPPAVEVDTTEDIELLDQGPPVNVEEEVELVDQGPPPTTAAEVPAPSTMTTVPVTTTVAPDASAGPVVPEGFGTGNVQVSTGTAGFPVGLEDCHVGAVTGRAYVGIDCGEGDGSSFVGHAPSFQDFPFVLDQSFPFNRESVFADPSAGQLDDDAQILVSAARDARFDDNGDAPVIRTSGASSVEFEQRAQGRNPRIESENGRLKRGNESRRGGNSNVTSSESQGGDRSSANSNHGKKKHGNDSNRSGSAKDNGKKSKSSKHAKNGGGKKGKKSQSSK